MAVNSLLAKITLLNKTCQLDAPKYIFLEVVCRTKLARNILFEAWIFSRKMLRNFPRIFEPAFSGSEIFRQIYHKMSLQKKKPPTSFCRRAERTWCSGSFLRSTFVSWLSNSSSLGVLPRGLRKNPQCGPHAWALCAVVSGDVEGHRPWCFHRSVHCHHSALQVGFCLTIPAKIITKDALQNKCLAVRITKHRFFVGFGKRGLWEKGSFQESREPPDELYKPNALVCFLAKTHTPVAAALQRSLLVEWFL